MIGRQLGPYHVVDRLGAGGMGEVYRARDTRLDRTVAIKVLTGALAGDPVSMRRPERGEGATGRRAGRGRVRPLRETIGRTNSVPVNRSRDALSTG